MSPKEKQTRKFDVQVHPFVIFELASTGHSEHKIAKRMGISHTALRIWKRKYEVVQGAIERGEERFEMSQRQAAKKRRDHAELSLQQAIFDRLPENLQSVWESLVAVEESPSEDYVYHLTKDLMKNEKQRLFAYSMCVNFYSVSRTCRLLGIPKSTYNFWTQSDSDFIQILKEIQEHKKDFVEGQLMAAVAAFDSKAIIFANRTLNKDRGYQEKIEVQGGARDGDQFPFELLPIELRKQILSFIVDHRSKTLEGTSRVIE